jgi:hypothetical protein
MRNEKEPSKKPSVRRFVAGAGLVGGDFVINRGIEVAAVAEASTLGFLNPTIGNDPVLALAAAMGVGAAASILSSIQNTRLNHEFGISPNGAATFTFALFLRQLPNWSLLKIRFL